MKIEKQNLAVPAIMAVATMIVLNAVVGQDGKHPAPIGGGASEQKITKSPKPVVNTNVLRRKKIKPKKVIKSTPPKLNDDMIAKLLSKDKPAKQMTTTSVGSSVVDNKKVKFVQIRLEELGFEPGPADGVMGKNTSEAIKKFEEARKLPVTGEISRALIEALSRSASFASLEISVKS